MVLHIPTEVGGRYFIMEQLKPLCVLYYQKIETSQSIQGKNLMQNHHFEVTHRSITFLETLFLHGQNVPLNIYGTVRFNLSDVSQSFHGGGCEPNQ